MARWSNCTTQWVTRDGRKMRLRDMAASHLANTVRYILREFNDSRSYRWPIVRALLTELSRRARPVAWAE